MDVCVLVSGDGNFSAQVLVANSLNPSNCLPGEAILNRRNPDLRKILFLNPCLLFLSSAGLLNLFK